MSYKISYSCLSHIGKVRNINQDNFICDGYYIENNDTVIENPLYGIKTSKKTTLFGIFDGMGGEECGEIASYIASKIASKIEIGKDVISDLSRFCDNANNEICDYSILHEVSSMGTTAAMLVFNEKEVYLCNIGDSKIFRLSNDILKQISVDHITFSTFGAKPPLSQNLGIPSSELIIEPYFARGSYKDGDVYLICSDGLSDMVSVEEMTKVLTTMPIEEAIMCLLDKALENGGKDNITIILCKVEHRLRSIFKKKTPKQKKRGKKCQLKF